jgi:hypothetical protein
MLSERLIEGQVRKLDRIGTWDDGRVIAACGV